MVHLTSTSTHRIAYRILREDCGLTHYEARAIFSGPLGPLSVHRNLMHKEVRREVDELAPVIEALAVLANRDDPDEAATRLRDLVEADDRYDYLLAKHAAALIRRWHGWGEAERIRFARRLRRVHDAERRSGLRKWDERTLLVYLRVRGLHL